MPFTAVTTWGYDQCDPSDGSQVEVRERAQQNQRLQEQTAVEKEFATDLLLRAGTASTPEDLVGAVAALEAALAKTGTVGVIHASAGLAAVAANLQLVVRNYRTPGRGGGEIDLVMRERDGTLVFVEVRSRAGSACHSPSTHATVTRPA